MGGCCSLMEPTTEAGLSSSDLGCVEGLQLGLRLIWAAPCLHVSPTSSWPFLRRVRSAADASQFLSLLRSSATICSFWVSQPTTVARRRVIYRLRTGSTFKMLWCYGRLGFLQLHQQKRTRTFYSLRVCRHVPIFAGSRITALGAVGIIGIAT